MTRFSIVVPSADDQFEEWLKSIAGRTSCSDAVPIQARLKRAFRAGAEYERERLALVQAQKAADEIRRQQPT